MVYARFLPDTPRSSRRLASPLEKPPMPTCDVAIVKEQGVTFAVVAVKDHVVTNSSEADRAVRAFTLEFGCPAVLMGAHNHRTYGRTDIVCFLESVHLGQLPWRRMN